jgi:hypothetical protein
VRVAVGVRQSAANTFRPVLLDPVTAEPWEGKSMNRKLFTLRQSVLAAAAVAAGSAAGTLAETIITNRPGVGQLAAAATALWILDKLNTLIDDTK